MIQEGKGVGVNSDDKWDGCWEESALKVKVASLQFII